jgi:hypothetical protein
MLRTIINAAPYFIAALSARVVGSSIANWKGKDNEKK